MSLKRDNRAERDALVTMIFGLLSTMWGAIVPVWMPVMLSGSDGVAHVLGWFGFFVAIIFTVVGWVHLIREGVTVPRSGVALAIVVFGSAGTGALALTIGSWGAFALLFLLDILAWRLISSK